MRDVEEIKALEDAVVHGFGYMVGGKHVPFNEVRVFDYVADDMTVEQVLSVLKKYRTDLEVKP